MKSRLNVLVNCERSGKVREAFRARGHNAWSCDLEGPDDWSKYHIQGDALVAARSRPWDLMIAHPPCTYLCNSGVCWLWAGKPGDPGGHGMWIKNRERWALLRRASIFFRELWDMNIPHIAIENPIPHRYAGLPRKYDQIIQPWMFGHPESKATCLWLRNLPKLVPTDDVKHIWKNLPKSKAQRLHYLSPGPQRAKLRSETYQGIADAMAEQWGTYVSNQL